MNGTSDILDILIDEFAKLPSIGRKTAQRLAMHVTKQPLEDIEQFSKALIETKKKIKFCKTCMNITENEECKICCSDRRNRNVICVVEEPQDVFAIEKTNEFKGVYHVLHGRISPLDGIGPNDIRLRELIMRLDESSGNSVTELILALNPTVEGETTILYISKLVKPLGIKISRIARGIPIGADIELTDEVTLAKAMEGRVDV
ncbi:MAG: recombination protein RecR [Ignavibacteria bacterium]|nr:recombination protein RecR [Ignavibacteria bacterium]